jgi:hypothetical protein
LIIASQRQGEIGQWPLAISNWPPDRSIRHINDEGGGGLTSI